MLKRQFYFKAMLAALIIGAVTSVLMVLTGSNEIVWRIVGTCFVLGVTSGLLMWMSSWIDKEYARPGGYYGMAAAIASTLFILLSIWEFPLFMDEEAYGLTGINILFHSIFVATMLRLYHYQLHRRALLIGIAAFAVSIIFCEIGIIAESVTSYSYYSTSSYNWPSHCIASGATMGCYGLLATFCLLGWDGYSITRRWWRWLGVIAAVISYGLILIGIWMELEEDPLLVTILTGITIVTAYANMVFIINLRRIFVPLKWLAIAAAILTSLGVDLLVWWDIHDSFVDYFSGRVTAAAALLAAFCFVIILVLRRMYRPIQINKTASEFTHVTIHCPMCGRKNTVPTNESSKCMGCNLIFELILREPRCPQCDYLLYMNQTNKCPECGCTLS